MTAARKWPTGPRPFRFGVVASGETSAREWRELARRTEGLGYSTLLIGDHFVEFLPVSGASPMLALAVAAEATDTLRLGTAMLGNDYRHPAVVAKEAATLDVLSDGRVELGLGAGWLQSDYEALGLEYPPISVRTERLAESLSIIRSAWSGQPFDFSGTHYSIRGYAGIPRPVQEPGPPVVVGGGSARVLRLAGQQADIVGLHVSTAALVASPAKTMADTQGAQTRRKLEWVKEGAGERFHELEFQVICIPTITDDAHGAAESVAARHGVEVEEARESAMILIGTTDWVCELVQRRREEWGVSYVVVPAGACDAFAPVVARLAGR